MKIMSYHKGTVSVFCGKLAIVAALALVLVQSASAAAERSLAGIKIFSKSSVVLQKYGSPTEVRVGDQSTTLLTSSGVGANLGGGAAGGPGALPSFGGGGPGGGRFGVPVIGPNGPGPGGLFGAGGPMGRSSAATSSATGPQNVTWVYDRTDGSSLEFLISPGGRVIQIHATGFKSAVRTGKGIVLGQNYLEVLSRYGYPESQAIDGKILNANYSEKFHAAFQFYNQKLVGIIVAAVE
jgi:hypothetical protein